MSRAPALILVVSLLALCAGPRPHAAEMKSLPDRESGESGESFESRQNTVTDPSAETTDGGVDPVPRWGAFAILGREVAPGARSEMHWSAGQSFDGSTIDTPVIVIRGKQPGPTLCLTAAVHGDELNGVEITRRVLSNIDPGELAGTVVGAPIVNLLGFSRGTRYLPDRRDLNRYFPGHPEGSSASRIAHVFFNGVIRHCDRLVDFHTGSFKRTNLPQLRADLSNPEVREFIERFGATAVLHKPGGRGTLRRAATEAGIPAVAFELGEPGTLQLKHVEFGVKALETLLDKLHMVDRLRLWSEPQPIYYRSRWLRAYRGGILTSSVPVGGRIRKGDVLGVVTNPLTNEQSEILAPYAGRLLGRALNQFVLPGFATFHIGIAPQPMEKAAPEIDESADDIAIDEGEDGPIDDVTGNLAGDGDAAFQDRYDEESH